MLIYNICREIKQIFVIFMSSWEFNRSSDDANDTNEANESGLKEKWLIIEKFGKEFDAVKEDELAASGQGVSISDQETQLVFPREQNGDYANFKLSVRYSMKARSHNSSANE